MASTRHSRKLRAARSRYLLDPLLASFKSPQILTLLSAAAVRYGLDPALLLAVAQRESGLDPNAVSAKGAQGVMQLMPATSRSLGVTDASPAVCSAAPAGSVTIAAAATTITVNTTAVTANSQIFVFEDSSLGTRLGVTCNTTTGRTYTVTARTAATSFVITSSAAPTTNPACLSYAIVN